MSISAANPITAGLWATPCRHTLCICACITASLPALRRLDRLHFCWAPIHCSRRACYAYNTRPLQCPFSQMWQFSRRSFTAYQRCTYSLLMHSTFASSQRADPEYGACPVGCPSFQLWGHSRRRSAAYHAVHFLITHPLVLLPVRPSGPEPEFGLQRQVFEALLSLLYCCLQHRAAPGAAPGPSLRDVASHPGLNQRMAAGAPGEGYQAVTKLAWGLLKVRHCVRVCRRKIVTM